MQSLLNYCIAPNPQDNIGIKLTILFLLPLPVFLVDFPASSDSAFFARLEDENARVQCQPRDRVVDSYEELGIPRGYGDFLYPECIVVRRCQARGMLRGRAGVRAVKNDQYHHERKYSIR